MEKEELENIEITVGGKKIEGFLDADPAISINGLSSEKIDEENSIKKVRINLNDETVDLLYKSQVNVIDIAIEQNLAISIQNTKEGLLVTIPKINYAEIFKKEDVLKSRNLEIVLPGVMHETGMDQHFITTGPGTLKFDD
jgi:MoaA/NifB/PqqE/SkfB family radical SAM enzyme